MDEPKGPWWAKTAQQAPALALVALVLYGAFLLIEPLFQGLAECVKP